MFEVVNIPSCTVFRICPTREAADAVVQAYAHLPLYVEALPTVSNHPAHW